MVLSVVLRSQLCLKSLGLCLVPEGVHLLEGHVLELTALAYGSLLDIVESADKLFVCALKSIVRVYFVKACHVDD